MGNFKRRIVLCENALNAVDGENTTVFGEDDADEDVANPLPTDDADDVEEVEVKMIADGDPATFTLPIPINLVGTAVPVGTESVEPMGSDEADEAQDGAEEEENICCWVLLDFDGVVEITLIEFVLAIGGAGDRFESLAFGESDRLPFPPFVRRINA